MTVLLGAHLSHLTNVDSGYAGPASPLAMRAIAAAGITANLIAGFVVLAAARRIPERFAAWRFLAWFYGHATLFMGASYLAGFAFLPFGDVHAAIHDLPLQLVWQIAFVLAGGALYRAALLDAERTIRRWAAGTAAIRLVLPPYLAMGIANTVAALFNPAGALYGALWAAAATFGAGYGLIAAAAGARDAASAPAEQLRIPRSSTWIAAGTACALTLLVILGPGIPR